MVVRLLLLNYSLSDCLDHYISNLNDLIFLYRGSTKLQPSMVSGHCDSGHCDPRAEPLLDIIHLTVRPKMLQSVEGSKIH